MLLTGVFYYGYKLLRRTQGAKVLSGFLLVFFVALFASRFLELRVLSFLLQAFVSVLVLAFLIPFQPEIRRALAEIGRAGGFTLHAERHLRVFWHLRVFGHFRFFRNLRVFWCWFCNHGIG